MSGPGEKVRTELFALQGEELTFKITFLAKRGHNMQRCGKGEKKSCPKKEDR